MGHLLYSIFGIASWHRASKNWCERYFSLDPSEPFGPHLLGLCCSPLLSSSLSCNCCAQIGHHQSSDGCSILLSTWFDARHTKKHVGWRRYLSFCSHASRVALPSSEETLLLFTSYLAKEGLAHTMIKVYLSAVCNLHVEAGLHQKFAHLLIIHVLCLGVISQLSNTIYLNGPWVLLQTYWSVF